MGQCTIAELLVRRGEAPKTKMSRLAALKRPVGMRLSSLAVRMLFFLALPGCYGTASVLDPIDAGRDASRGPDAFVREDSGPRPGEPPSGAVVCGGGVCATGEECCLLTVSCVPLGDASCAIPAGTTDPDACTRQSDCDANEICGAVDESGGLRWTGECGGRVGQCFVVVSAGNPLLDKAGCQALIKRARYKPAIGLDGKPTVGWQTRRIVWRLPR